MSKSYETELTEVMKGLIGLCMEALEGVTPAVERVYAISYVDECRAMFNAFVRHQGQIKTLNLLNIDSDLYDSLLRVGADDVETLRPICRRYDQPLPNEIRMIYDLPTRKFIAEIQYDAPEDDRSAGGHFWDWLKEKQIANGQLPEEKSADQPPEKKSFGQRLKALFAPKGR